MLRLLARAVLLLCVLASAVMAEPRVNQRRGLTLPNELIAQNHPYVFLSMPRGRSGEASIQGFEVIEEHDNDDDMAAGKSNKDEDEVADDDEEDLNNIDDDDNDDGVVLPRKNFASLNDDDDDEDAENDDDEVVLPRHPEKDAVAPWMKNDKLKTIMHNAKQTHMMVPREYAGAIMVPDGIIEIEGQSVVDEKTGRTALLVPRAALDAIPDGSVVALMERSGSDNPEERANRVIVRRRRKGSRRNVRRRNNNRRNNNKRRRGGGGNNNRRRVNKRKNVRVVRTGGSAANRRRRNNRNNGINRPIVLQG